MKKGIIFGIAALLILCIVAAAGVVAMKLSSPEYALAKTLADIKESGIPGLEKHLTADAREMVEKIESVSALLPISELMSYITKNDGIGLLKSKLAEIDWRLEDVFKEKDTAKVMIGFNYQDLVSGTIPIVMVREEGEWKIDGIGIPSFDTGSE